MKRYQVHEYIERLANLFRKEARQAAAAYGLQPVQLEALKYLNLCNRYSDTPLGVTEYLGLTKGTVSQSIMMLVKKGFVEKLQDKKDKRVVHLKLTAEGKRLLKHLQPSQLLQNIPNDMIDLAAMVERLDQLLRTIQLENDLKTFGVCHSCRYNQTLENGKHRCGLTEEILSKRDIQLICREHTVIFD